MSSHEMELLARSLKNAHRLAVQAELNAAGLEKVGHPMLVSILQSADEDPEGQFQAQRPAPRLPARHSQLVKVFGTRRLRPP